VNDSVQKKTVNRLRGLHPITLDQKGRFNVPAKIKKVLEKNYGREAELTVSVQENYLLVYPEVVSSQKAEEYDSYDGRDEKKRKSLRELFMHEEDCEIKSGKILFPAKLRKKVGLKNGDEAVVVGTNLSFEVWPKDQFEKVHGKIEL